MTRAELEQMKRLVIDLIDAVPDRNAGGLLRSGMRGLAILDAELEKPEAREWGVRPTESEFVYAVINETAARECKAQYPDITIFSRRAEKVICTPAGPWEAVRSIGSVLAAALVVAPVLAVCLWGGN